MASTYEPGVWARLRDPVIALILGIVPYWLFVGMAQQITINGVRTESRVNFAGMVLGFIGAWMAIRVLRGNNFEERWWPRLVLAVLALIVCIVQFGWSVELHKIELLKSWLAPLIPR